MEKYAKVRVLGKGSFGSAILIKRRSDNALLVIKEVFLGKLSKKEREEARHECRVLQQLNHPNIVRYVEHFENRDNLYIVMEYCDGGDLGGKLKNGPMKESTILHYYSQICLAMEYLHSRYILHRDIKTMNVFLMKNGSVKLGDFGIATVLRNTLGMANTVCGTPYYFSPELCRNKPYNNKSDVWALGVLLYELATGRHPFDANSMPQLMQRILRGVYTPLQSHFSLEFRKMVEWCLKKDPAQRPSIRQLLALPIVRRALDQLEENLMLATQCKVRLKDIIDFDVGGDSNNNSNNNDNEKKVDTEQRTQERKLVKNILSPPRVAEVSPGRAAAVALAGQQVQRQQVPQRSPHRLPPGAEAAVQLLAQQPPSHYALLGPKPNVAGAVVDHNRVDNYRRHLQQQYQRMLGGDKNVICAPPVVSSPSGNPSPSAQPQVSPRRQQPLLQPQPQRNAGIGVADCRLVNNMDPSRQKNAGNNYNNNAGGGDGFDERMQRVNAIMQRYARNVDPKARDTIRAYMKRKQEEYVQQQRKRLERVQRSAERRKKELAKVIEQQNRIARGDSTQQNFSQQQKVVNQTTAVSPNPVTPTSAFSTPRKEQQQKQQQQQQLPPTLQQEKQKYCVFGRDPRFVPRHIRELEQPTALQKCDQGLKEGNNYGSQRIKPRVWKKGKVVALNSPFIVGLPKPKQRMSALHPVLDPLVGSDQPQSAESAAAAACFVRPIHNEKTGELNRKKNSLQPVSGRESLRAAVKGKSTSDISVSRQRLSIMKGSSPKEQKRQIQQQKASSGLCIVSAPVFVTSLEDSSPTRDNSDDKVGEDDDRKDVAAPAQSALQPSVRLSSAPLRPLAEDCTRHCTNTLSEFQADDKSKILSTAAAGIMSVGISIPSQPVQREVSPGRFSTPTTGLAPICGLSFFSKEDLPAGVEDRRRLARQCALLTEFKLPLEEQPGKANGTPPLQTPRGRMELSNNIVENKNNKKRRGSYAQPVDEKDIFHPSVGTVEFGHDPSGTRPRRKKLPPPMSLVPLQIRSVSSFLPQSKSTFLLSSPPKAVVGRTLSKQPLPRVTGNDVNQSQPVVGIMPTVQGVRVPSQPRGSALLVGGGGGGNPVSCAAQNGMVSEPTLFVNIDYGVSAAQLDNVSKQAALKDSNFAANLPSLGDVGVQPPDVVQQWRDIVEVSGGPKVLHRPPIMHLRSTSALAIQTVDEGDDVLAAFQKENNVGLTVPSTLEALCTLRDNEAGDMMAQMGRRFDASLALLKQKQRRKTNSFTTSTLPGAMPGRVMLPLSMLSLDEQGIAVPLQQSSQLSLKITSSRDKVLSLLSESSSESLEDAEERAALVALVDDDSDARANDDLDHGNASIVSSDNQREHSLDSYLAMLDHLRGLLYRRSEPERVLHSQPQEEQEGEGEGEGEKSDELRISLQSEENVFASSSRSGDSMSEVGDLPTPVNFEYTRTNCGHHKDPHKQFIQSVDDDGGGKDPVHDLDLDEEDYEDSAEEEVEDYDNDEDFEDALPLSFVRCAALSDTYRRLLKNAGYVTDILSTSEGPNDDNATGFNAVLSDDGAKEMGQGNASDSNENVASVEVCKVGTAEGDRDKNCGTMCFSLTQSHATVLSEREDRALV